MILSSLKKDKGEFKGSLQSVTYRHYKPEYSIVQPYAGHSIRYIEYSKDGWLVSMMVC